jgi:hypothetical protein
MSPGPSANLGEKKPEVITHDMNGHYDEIITSQQSMFELLSSLDAVEADNAIHRIKVEGQCVAKMDRIQNLRKENAEHGGVAVEIAQEFEENDNLAEVEKDLSSKLETLHHRIETVEEEFRVHMDKDQELGFLKERTEGKQMRVDLKEANLASINQFESEGRVVAFGPRIAQVTEALRTEERLLDEALSNLPVHVKIQVLTRLCA